MVFYVSIGKREIYGSSCGIYGFYVLFFIPTKKTDRFFCYSCMRIKKNYYVSRERVM